MHLIILIFLLGYQIQSSACFNFRYARSLQERIPTTASTATQNPRYLATSEESNDDNASETSSSNSAALSKTSIKLFLDMAVAEEPVGRLVFQIPDTTILPLHIDNVVKLCTQERASIDPRCKYVGCEFQHSPQFVEGFAQYRWGHTLKGRGRNAVGRAEERITDPEKMSKCTHSIYGGQYYGLNYDTEVPILGDQDNRVVLTVPLVGPGRGSTDLSIVRVGESPPEWKERLLLNCAVLGWLEPSSLETLHAMARQTKGPPKVVDSGVLE